jgi:iron(III) transport system ATP-binding protein
VAIARALAFEPRVLLLDEPLSNLDARLRLQMGDEFRALQQRLGITSLYVTHDQDEAMALSDRVVVMRAGRILQAAPPRELYRRPQSRAVASFFGSPNLLEAQVVGQAQAPANDNTGGVHWHDVRGRGWSARVPAARAFESGETVAVLVRPESLQLRDRADANADAGLAWQGRIAQSVFRGARQSLVVETALHAFNLDLPSSVRVSSGDNVTIGVPSDEAWIVSV